MRSCSVASVVYADLASHTSAEHNAEMVYALDVVLLLTINQRDASQDPSLNAD
jgi:hypothetical protein